MAALPDNLFIPLVTVAVVIVAVLLHYEGLRVMTRWITSTAMGHKARIALLINALLALHALEIALFGTVYWGLNALYGNIIAADNLSWADFNYFSATVYSTLGFGDLLPVGPTRFLVGMESVSGLLLITWSASFTYLEMARYWQREDS